MEPITTVGLVPYVFCVKNNDLVNAIGRFGIRKFRSTRSEKENGLFGGDFIYARTVRGIQRGRKTFPFKK